MGRSTSELAIGPNDGTRVIIRSSKHSGLPPEPLFTVVASSK
jgi:hypothetical protein